jgi:hypothetical protein
MPVHKLPRFEDRGGIRTVRGADASPKAPFVAPTVTGHHAAPRIVPSPDCLIEPRECMWGIRCLQAEKVETVMSGAQLW